MGSKMGSNPWKFELQGWLGAPGRPSWRQDGPRCDLGRVWDSIWRSVGAHLGAKIGQVRAKMGQDGPKTAILDLNMAILRPFWEASCLLFGILGAKSQIAKNIEKHQVFKSFWNPGGDLGGHLGSSWRYVGPSWRHVGPSCRHLGPSWRQNGVQERQHEPTCRPRAPTWRKRAA